MTPAAGRIVDGDRFEIDVEIWIIETGVSGRSDFDGPRRLDLVRVDHFHAERDLVVLVEQPDDRVQVVRPRARLAVLVLHEQVFVRARAAEPIADDLSDVLVVVRLQLRFAVGVVLHAATVRVRPQRPLRQLRVHELGPLHVVVVQHLNRRQRHAVHFVERVRFFRRLEQRVIARQLLAKIMVQVHRERDRHQVRPDFHVDFDPSPFSTTAGRCDSQYDASYRSTAHFIDPYNTQTYRYKRTINIRSIKTFFFFFLQRRLLKLAVGYE